MKRMKNPSLQLGLPVVELVNSNWTTATNYLTLRDYTYLRMLGAVRNLCLVQSARLIVRAEANSGFISVVSG